MLGREDDYYVPIGQEFIRSGYLSEVGPNACMVYAAIRTYSWRSTRKGAEELRELVEQGKVASHVSVEKISALTGISDRQVKREIEHLRQLGWMATERLKGRTLIFLLGEVVMDSKGGRHEVYHADAVICQKIEEYRLAGGPVSLRPRSGDTLSLDRCHTVPGPVPPWPLEVDKQEVEKEEVQKVETSAAAQVAAPSHLDRPSKFNGSGKLHHVPDESEAVDPDTEDSGEAVDPEADGLRRRLRGNETVVAAKHKTLVARRERKEKILERETVVPLPIPSPSSEKFGSTELWRFWRMSVASIMKKPETEIGNWTVKQKTQARKLLETYDRKVVCDLVVWMATNWKAICEMYKIRGAEAPTIGITLGYRESFVASMSKPLPKQGRLVGEYDSVTAAGDPAFGWRDDV